MVRKFVKYFKNQTYKVIIIIQQFLITITLAVLAASAILAVHLSLPLSHAYPMSPISTIPAAARPLSSGLNINTATKKELMELPGIGEVLAQAIIDSRKNDGMFHYLEDLLMVRGIGEKTFADIESLIYVK